MTLARRLFTSKLTITRVGLCTRHYATAPPVDLDYELRPSPNGNDTDSPLLILHGLFGSKQNWGSLSKAFAKDLGKPVYTLDLRNHGRSPHSSPMTYPQMAEDVRHFIEKHKLKNVSLLGHSMGGKVAMALALALGKNTDILSKLIVADIAPSRGPLSAEFRNYIKAMMHIEAENVKTRKEADTILAQYEPDIGVRAFLLTNLIPASTQSPAARFRVPLPIINDAIPHLGDFPYEPGEGLWSGPALFIKGTRSKYINKNNVGLAHQLFPNMNVEELDAGHWVHAEKPAEFAELLCNFVRD